jgi:ApeA N-terminal domain 1
MKIYRLNALPNVIGAFWPPENPNEVTTGTLSPLDGRLYLLASPSFRKLNADEISAAVSEFGTNRKARRIDSLLGQTKDGPCTLLYLVETLTDGLTDFVNNFQIVGERWRVGSAVMGLHIESAESASIDAAAFYFTKIHKWLPSPTKLRMTEEGISHISPSKAVQFFRLDSASLQAEVICEIFAGKKPAKSFPRIRITPHKPKSIEWFVFIGPRLENFFSLLLGTSVSLKSVQLFQGDKKDGWFIKKMSRSRPEKINIESWVRCLGSQAAEALEKWFAVPDEQRPVERTVLGMSRKSSLFTETEFLALAQALEGFGRLRFERDLIPKAEFKKGLTKLKEALVGLWGDSEITKRCSDVLNSANEASYGQRIGQTYDLLSKEFATDLLGERSEFVQKIVQTRNYFTHLGIRKGTAVVDDGNELFFLNQRLHAFLRCVMLMELGISEDALKEPISYQATKWKPA